MSVRLSYDERDAERDENLKALGLEHIRSLRNMIRDAVSLFGTRMEVIAMQSSTVDTAARKAEREVHGYEADFMNGLLDAESDFTGRSTAAIERELADAERV